MFTSYRNIMARNAAGEMDESGFTLIELLIVIVVLGILAGVVIFALGGVTGQSAVAACKADGATVSTALAAFNTDNPNVTATPALMLPVPADGTIAGGGAAPGEIGGPFLQSWPSNGAHYSFSLDSATGALYIQVPAITAITENQTTAPSTGSVLYSGPTMAAGTHGCADVS